MRRDLRAKIYLLVLAVACVCTSPVSAVDSAIEAELMEAQKTASPAAVRKSKSLRQRMLMSNIASVSAPSDPNATTPLNDYIRRLEALRLPEVKAAGPDAASSQGGVATVANNIAPVTQSPAPADPNALAMEEDAAMKAYARRIAAMLAEGEGVVHPLEVGNALYAGKDYVNAAKFYRLAIQRMSDDKAHPDRPWALFQVGNSLRLDDKAEAAKFYDLLISEFPNSPWTAAAKVEQTIATWSAAESPETLLEKYASDPNSL